MVHIWHTYRYHFTLGDQMQIAYPEPPHMHSLDICRPQTLCFDEACLTWNLQMVDLLVDNHIISQLWPDEIKIYILIATFILTILYI